MLVRRPPPVWRVAVLLLVGALSLAATTTIASAIENYYVAELEDIVAAMPPGPHREALAAKLAAVRTYTEQRNADEAAFIPPTEVFDPGPIVADIASYEVPPARGVIAEESPLYKNFIQTTYWQDQVGEFWYEVYAGASREDPAQGLVYWSEPLPDGPAYKAIPAPGPTGVLTIVSAEDGVLTIGSEGGATYEFDVRTGAFL